MPLTGDDPLVALLKRHEGRNMVASRHHPYRDQVGKLTIGYGRNLDDMGLSEPEAIYLLRQDIARTHLELSSMYGWFNGLDQVRQDALVDLCFNIGLPKFQGFKLMIGHLERKEFEAAGDELLNSRYADQVGDRAQELAFMVRTGTYRP